MAQEKAAEEKANKEKLERERKEELAKMNDPAYAEYFKQKRKEEIQASEDCLIGDLFGNDFAPSKTSPATADDSDCDTEEYRDPELVGRAKELAEASGLFDGKDGLNTGDTGPQHKRGDVDSSEDTIVLANDNDATELVKKLVTKVKAIEEKTADKNSAASVSKVLLLDLIRELGPLMKATDMDEVLRVATVQKNNLAQKTRNIKKKSKRPQVRLHDNGQDDFDSLF